MKKPSFPILLLLIHTALVSFCMLAHYNGIYLTSMPYDCFYMPLFLTSGPLVYFVAHDIQHLSEHWFSNANVEVVWNLIPGTVCLILGGLQWWLIGHLCLFIKRRFFYIEPPTTTPSP